jgi:type II secretory pathway component PulJ
MKSFNHRNNEEGFSLIDAVITFAIISALMVGGVISFSAMQSQLDNMKVDSSQQEDFRK